MPCHHDSDTGRALWVITNGVSPFSSLLPPLSGILHKGVFAASTAIRPAANRHGEQGGKAAGDSLFDCSIPPKWPSGSAPTLPSSREPAEGTHENERVRRKAGAAAAQTQSRRQARESVRCAEAQPKLDSARHHEHPDEVRRGPDEGPPRHSLIPAIGNPIAPPHVHALVHTSRPVALHEFYPVPHGRVPSGRMACWRRRVRPSRRRPSGRHPCAARPRGARRRPRRRSPAGVARGRSGARRERATRGAHAVQVGVNCPGAGGRWAAEAAWVGAEGVL